MAEGSLGPPQRHPVRWQDPDYLDEAKLDAELRRVFDICHGCRRCFNLCDSFPRLFDLVDSSATGEVDGVASRDFARVAGACTLCDMCFMTKCPYVPPHEWDVDFPHLMLRYRTVQFANRRVGRIERQLKETDRNGRLATALAPLVNWATRRGNKLTRPALERAAGVHRDAELPRYHRPTLERGALADRPEVNRKAPAFGRKAVIFATCFANYNNPAIGTAARAVLAKNGVETEVVYPGCCGMPQLENGDLARVAASARTAAETLAPWLDKGYQVISLVPSCSLMIKCEWPLIVPGDTTVGRLAEATSDISEYVVAIARREGLADGLVPLAGEVTLHIACHSRAQNMGHKAAEMLRLVPEARIKVIERCSGHGGAWGVMKENFGVALRVGRPVASQAARHRSAFVVSECPLARDHIVQGIERLGEKAGAIEAVHHPIQLMARAYGL